MMIYPNPATDYTNLTINAAEEGIFNLMIVDMAGKSIQTKKLELTAGENTVNLDLSSITNGVYMVSLNKGSLIINKKLIVNN